MPLAPLPLQPVVATWMAVAPIALFLAVFARLSRRHGARIAAALQVVGGIVALVGLFAARPGHPLATPALLVVEAGAFRLEAVLSAGPVAFGLAAALAFTAALASLRHPVGSRGLGWASMLAAAAATGLLAGDLVVFSGTCTIAAVALLGLLRASAREDELPGTGVRAFFVVQAGGAAWLAGAVVLAWALGGSGWGPDGALRKTSGLAVLKGPAAAAEVSVTRFSPALLGVDEAIAAGDRQAAGATWVVPGPTFSVVSLKNLVRTPSSGIGARLDAMRLFGLPVLLLVALLWIVAIALGTGQIAAGWWRGLDAVPAHARPVLVLATSLPPLAMIGRFEFLVERAGAGSILAAVGLAGALVAVGSDRPVGFGWRALRVLAPVATVMLGIAADAPWGFAAGLAVVLVVGGIALRFPALAAPARALRAVVKMVLELVAGVVRALANVVAGLDSAVFDAPWDRLGDRLIRLPAPSPMEPRDPGILGVFVPVALLAASVVTMRPLVVVTAIVAAAGCLSATSRRVLLAIVLQAVGSGIALVFAGRLAAAGLAIAGVGHLVALPPRASGGARLRAVVLGLLPAGLVATDVRWLVVAGFLLRIPVVPFHAPTATLLAEMPAAYALVASAAGPMVAVQGLLRLGPLEALAPFALASLAWAALSLVAQEDLRKLALAPATIAGSFAVLALASTTLAGLEASLLLAVSGALATGLATASAEALVSRAGHRFIDGFGGLVARAPELALASAVASGAVAGLPGTAGFPANVLAVAGAFGSFPWLAAAALVAMTVAAGALAWTVDRVHLGPFHEKYRALTPPTARERLVLGLLGLALVIAGFAPDLVTRPARAGLEAMAAAAAGR